MARVAAALVHVDTLVVRRGAESRGALAHRLAVLHLAHTVVAVHQLARVVAFVRASLKWAKERRRK